jgi:hypothetical protein
LICAGSDAGRPRLKFAVTIAFVTSSAPLICTAARQGRLKETAIMTEATKPADAASRLIDKRISSLAGWRGETLARMRGLILSADPEIIEEWKWMGTPVWSRGGIICTGESYKSVVKLTFHKGASLPDPAGIFNASLEGNARRAIDIKEGESVDADAFTALVRAAIALNSLKTTKVKA